jgi:hypothetical protein
LPSGLPPSPGIIIKCFRHEISHHIFGVQHLKLGLFILGQVLRGCAQHFALLLLGLGLSFLIFFPFIVVQLNFNIFFLNIKGVPTFFKILTYLEN